MSLLAGTFLKVSTYLWSLSLHNRRILLSPLCCSGKKHFFGMSSSSVNITGLVNILSSPLVESKSVFFEMTCNLVQETFVYVHSSMHVNVFCVHCCACTLFAKLCTVCVCATYVCVCVCVCVCVYACVCA